MKLVTINYLRFYAILSLVVWHCFVCPLTCWQLIEPTEATNCIGWIAQWLIPGANMPLFVFIAGFVFAFALDNGKYKAFCPFLWNKTKRLVIPFFTLGTIICLSAPERYLYQIGWGEGSHLWFCMMLFWIFIAAWLVNRPQVPVWARVLVFLASCGYVLYNHCLQWSTLKLPLGLHHTFFFYCYFCMGEFVYRKRDNTKLLWGMLGFLILIYIAARFGSSIGIKGVSRISNFMLCPMVIMVLYMLARFIPEQQYKTNGFVDTICVYGFGIYVFHEWISWCVYHYQPIYELFTQSPILFAATFMVVDFWLSVLLTHLCLKTKVGKFLLA